MKMEMRWSPVSEGPSPPTCQLLVDVEEKGMIPEGGLRWLPPQVQLVESLFAAAKVSINRVAVCAVAMT